MPRLFTGLELPQNIIDILSFYRGGLSNSKWIDANNYHITLKFIGDIDERLAREIEYGLRTIRRKPFTAHISELCAFGGDKPHSLVAMVKPSLELMSLQTEIDRLLMRYGVQLEQRRFTPHITLARLKGTRPAEVADYIALRAMPCTLEFNVEQFALFSSRSGTGGGQYMIEADYPLLQTA